MSAPDDLPLLEVRQLTKRFPGVLALDQVDLQLKQGEVLAVIGENGAGKSTVLKIMAGVDTDFDGKVQKVKHSCSARVSMSEPVNC